MNVIFWDIETSRMTVKSFSLFPKYISHSDIVERPKILCVCWKQAGSKLVKSVSYMDDGDLTSDRNVIETVHKVLSNADVIVHHNGDKFDLKKFNAKVIEYGLPPLPPLLQIDTLKEYKKIASTESHRLDFLGQTLVGERKIHTDASLWEGCEKGDIKAMKKMVKYCRQDVALLEKVYDRIKPYIKRAPNLVDTDGLKCPKCASSNLRKHKDRIMASGIRKKQYQCGDCGSYSTPRYNSITSKSTLN